MPYEVYRLLHLLFIFSFILFIGSYFFSDSVSKITKIGTGIVSLLIFVAGMGLIARIGVGHGEPWPNWIKAKIGIWLILAIGTPILGKRVQGDIRKKIPWILLSLMVIAAYLAIYKPF